MIIYFLLVGFASTLVGIEFIKDTNDPALKMALLSNIKSHSKGEMSIEEAFRPIDRLRNKAILMIFIILFVMIIVLTMFIKNITEPLQHMIEVSGKISTGDLSMTIHIHSDNELSELGNVINEMSSNLQEIILLSKNMCRSGQDFVKNALEILKEDAMTLEKAALMQKEVEYLKNELDILEEIIEYFNFYTIKDKP